MTKAITLLCVGLLWGAALPLRADSPHSDPGEAGQILQAKNTARGRLVIDGRTYALTPTTQLRDAWGHEIGLEDLPVPEVSAPRKGNAERGARVEIRVAPGDGPARLLELRYLPSRAR